MIIDFSLEISQVVWGLLGLLVVFAIIGATLGLRHMRAVARAGRRVEEPLEEPLEDTPEEKAEAQEAQDEVPGLSVIVYARNAEDNIAGFLRQLLDQDHPDFEVIVVNDASIDNTAEIVDNMLAEDPRLYLTFVSDSAINISRRKLAYTLGMRAAKKPVALLTAANVEIPSRSWLRRMAAPFADPQVDMAVGALYMPVASDKGLGRYWRSFDSQVTDTRWVGAALLGSPYRGVRENLAVRVQAFFDNGGFTSTNRFQGGEDDIFVGEIAGRGEVATVFTPQATPTLVIPEDEYPRLWVRNKEHYTFTGRYLHTGAFRTQGVLSLCNWVVLLSAIAAGLLGWPNLLPACLALFGLLLYWGYQICVYRRSARAMRTIRLFWAVPLFWLIRPLATASYNTSFHSNRYSQYTWQQPR